MQYTKKERIDGYITILTEMGYLDRRTPKREKLIRDILDRCKDEFEMSRKLHDLYTGDLTMDEFIERYAVCIEQ